MTIEKFYKICKIIYYSFWGLAFAYEFILLLMLSIAMGEFEITPESVLSGIKLFLIPCVIIGLHIGYLYLIKYLNGKQKLSDKWSERLKKMGYIVNSMLLFYVWLGYHFVASITADPTF